MRSSPKVARWRIAAVVASTAIFAGMLPSTSPVHADDPPAFHMLDNGRLRFGGNNNNNCSSACATVSTPEDSVSSIGLLKQPFYFSNVDSRWHKLTYSTYPLNLAVGTGTGGSNWSGNTVFAFNPNSNPPNLSGLTADATGLTPLGPVGAGDRGYGTIVSNGTATINGQAFAVTERFDLGATDSFVKITTTLHNVSGSAATNVNMWVGTQDDYVGSNDGPTKVKGNLVDGAFAPTTTAAEPASALMITSGPEGVLFYSTTPATNVAINSCCNFRNAYNTNPVASQLTRTDDGSYAMNLPVGDLADGASTSIVWYYGAGATADLANIASAISNAANPPVPPTSVAGSHQATVSWTAPDSDSPITDYALRYRIAGSSDAWVEVRKGDANAPLVETFTGLADGVAYEFQVAGVTGTSPNEVVGDYSESTIVMPGTPVNSGLPTIEGTPLVGSTLTVVDPDTNWTSTDGSPMTATYQWQVDGVDIPGATSVDFLVTAAEAGRSVRVVATRTNASGGSSAQSADVAVPTVYLDSLDISDGTLSPAFTPEQTSYTTTVGTDVSSISLAPTAVAGATVTVNGLPLVEGAAPVDLELGVNTFTVVTTLGADSVSYTVTIIRGDAPTAVDVTMGSLRVGDGFAATAAADGAPAPTFAITAGALPDGLSLDATTGEISGTPTIAGDYSFTLTATNVAGSTSTTYSGTVDGYVAAPTEIAVTMGSLRVGDGFATVVTSDGVPAPTFAITAGALPDGLSLDPDTGVITGTPTTPGPYSFTLTATNAAGSTSSTYTGTVAPASGEPSGSAYVPLAPHRLLDTRDEGSPLVAGSITTVHVAGSNGVPADATAVVLNVTSTESDAPGFVTAYPCGASVPTASNVNWVAGETIANRVVVALDASGNVCLFSYARTHLVVDLNGAYSPTAGTSPLVPLAPHRLLDTRDAGVKTTAGSVTEVQVTGMNGVPADARAVVLNVTATQPDGPGFVTVFPCGTAVPTASNLNFVAGQTISNSVTATVGTDGKVCLFTYVATHVVVDLNGAYSPTEATALLTPIAPVRLLDTRNDGSQPAAGTISEVQVTGANGVPDKTTAVVLNVTATESKAPGFVTVFPCGTPVPTASNVNFDAGQTIPISATAAVGTDGKVCLFTYATTHLVVDLDAVYVTQSQFG